MSTSGYQTYGKYRDDVSQWLGEVPADWKFEKAKWFLSHCKQLNIDGKINNILSLTLRGVVNNDPENPEGLIPKDYRTYQIFEQDDLVFKLIDLENVRTSRVGIVHEQGIMSSAYIRIKLPSGWNARFMFYYYFHLYQAEVFNKIGSGVRSTLSQSDLLELPIPVIDTAIQNSIVVFLDQKCASVDQAVRIKEKEIDLLRERRQIMIQEAVTRGLDHDVLMKNSGIDWIGLIPVHWRIERAKWLYKKMDRPVRLSDDIVTCFRDGQVTLRTNRRTDGFTNALKEHGYQGIRKGDLVIHAMDAFAGAIGVSDSDGKSTPVYSVCVPRISETVDPYFHAYFIRNVALSGLLTSLAKGIRERSTDFRFNDFSDLELAFPPLIEQRAIVKAIEESSRKIEKVIAIKQEQITALNEYKTCLINSAVTGKIKVI